MNYFTKHIIPIKVALIDAGVIHPVTDGGRPSFIQMFNDFLLKPFDSFKHLGFIRTIVGAQGIQIYLQDLNRLFDVFAPFT